MKFIKPLNEKKPKGAPDFHHSDAPDAEGRFRDLGIKDLAAWLIKTRKKDVKKISGSLTQQVVFNRNDDPEYAEKMEKVRKEVYKQLGRKDLLDKMDESLEEPLYNSFFFLEFQSWVYKNRAKINRMSKDEKIAYLEDNYIKKYGNKHLGSEDLSGVGSDIYHAMVLDKIIKESIDGLDNAKDRLENVYKHLEIEHGQTRRGDKYVQIHYIPVSRPQSQYPEWVKVFYDNDKDLKKIGKELGMDLKESVLEGKMPDKYIGNDDIVYLKTKEDSRGAHYNLYYKGHDIDVGGRRFGSEKELEDFASNYILSNQLYRKLRYADAIPLPESVLNEEETYNDYPAAAKKNAQMAIDWKEKYGRDEVPAGTPVGWARAHQLAKGEKISADTVKRMSAFNRHRKNSKIAPEYKDTPWKDNGYVAWLIWGGDAGVDWAMNKSKEIDNVEESKKFKHIKSLNEGYWSHYEYDKWTKANGKPKYPKWVKTTLKEIVKGGFMEPVYDAEHNYMVLWLASLENKRRSELYAYDNKGKKEFGKVGYAMYQRFYNDLTGYNMFFMAGALYALEVSKQIQDKIANGESIEPAYYLMKEYFNNFGMDTKRSRIFNAAYEKLEKWMKDNQIKTL